MQVAEVACSNNAVINERGCLTLLTEVTGQAVVQVLVELGTVSPLQPRAQTKVRQLHVTLETQNTPLEPLKSAAHSDVQTT